MTINYNINGKRDIFAQYHNYDLVDLLKVEKSGNDRSVLQMTGNHKIDNSIATYSMTMYKTCLNCSTCAGQCYAAKSYRQYSNVRESWDKNYQLSKYAPELFKARIIAELKKSRKQYCRIHVSGDFYSADYTRLWIDICKACPDVKFFTYTKVDESLPEIYAAVTELDSLPNCHIVKSLYKGKRNFGSMEYIGALKSEITAAGHSCHICGCGIEEGVKCGRDCTACAKYDYVLFLEH